MSALLAQHMLLRSCDVVQVQVQVQVRNVPRQLPDPDRASVPDPDRPRTSVAAIATSCGFTDPERFAGAYRAAYGVSPSSTLLN
jgi:AraC-like DNA-binding protein